jgi:hypothetical protein
MHVSIWQRWRHREESENIQILPYPWSNGFEKKCASYIAYRDDRATANAAILADDVASTRIPFNDRCVAMPAQVERTVCLRTKNQFAVCARAF